MLSRKIAGFIKCESAQSVVEFTMIFPIILLLVLGIIEFSLMINAYQIVQYGAFMAARSYAVHYENGDDAKDFARRAASAACVPLTQGLMTTAIDHILSWFGGSTSSWQSNTTWQNICKIDKVISSYALTEVEATEETIGKASCLPNSKTEYKQIKITIRYKYALKFPMVNTLADYVNTYISRTHEWNSPSGLGVIHGSETSQDMGFWMSAASFFTGLKFIEITRDCTMGSEWGKESK